MDTTPRIETGTRNNVQWMHARAATPRGLIFAPPLIGGHALQQIRLLRPMRAWGYDVISFSYAGHGASRGVFSFQAALDNCFAMLQYALDQARQGKLPLFGLASCFGALPMLHTAGRTGEPFGRMALINAIPHWRWEKLVIDFVARWPRSDRRWFSINGIRGAMDQYIKDLFPQVSHHKDAFGILPRRRMHWRRMAAELWTYRRKPPETLIRTPVLCAYGRHDRLLRQIGFADWSGYESTIRTFCPRARFWRWETDHFFSTHDARQHLIQTLIRFFDGESNLLPGTTIV